MKLLDLIAAGVQIRTDRPETNPLCQTMYFKYGDKRFSLDTNYFEFLSAQRDPGYDFEQFICNCVVKELGLTNKDLDLYSKWSEEHEKLNQQKQQTVFKRDVFL